MAAETRYPVALEMATVLLRWWWTVVAGLSLGLAGGWVAFNVLPKTFEATTTILVTPPQIPKTLVPSTVTEDMSVRLRALREAVLSRPFLLKLIEEVYAPPKDETARQALINSIRLRVDAKVIQNDERTGAGMFALTFRDSDPDRTARVANRLAALFIEENTKLRTSQALGTTNTMKDLADEVLRNLEKKEVEIAEFRSANLYQLNDHLPANLQLLSSRQSDLENNERELAQVGERLRLLESQRDQMPALSRLPGAEGQGSDPVGARLALLRNELDNLRSRYTDEHPQVKAAQRRLDAFLAEHPNVSSSATQAGSGAPQAVGKPAIVIQIENAQAELDRLRKEQDRIKSDIALYRSRVEATPRTEQQLAELSKGHEILVRQYQDYQGKFEEAKGSLRIETDRKGGQFNIIDPAVAPAQPIKPVQFQLMLAGGLLGLCFCAGPFLIRRLLFPTVNSEIAVSSLAPQIPVLVTIEELDTPEVRRRRAVRMTINITCSAVGLATLLAVILLLPNTP